MRSVVKTQSTSMYDDKKCQAALCHDKNCQDIQCVLMWPVKPAMTKSSHMQLAKPAILQSHYKKKCQVKQLSLCNDKNCQFTKKHNYGECHIRPVSLCNDKNCQSV